MGVPSTLAWGPGDLVERVTQIMKETSEEVIEPRWRMLREEEIRSKSPGELVTVADEDAERLLARRLAELTPGIPVVGEEATSADPGLRDLLTGERAWLVDPIDGTSNFIDGGDRWSVMVALVQGGETCLSWIWRAPAGTLYIAERGAGATRNGRPLHRPPPAGGADRALKGAAFTRFFDTARAERIWANAPSVGEVAEGSCAGYDYPALAEGLRDFLLFWRTLPWDHAPGTLLVAEAGAYVRRISGASYRPDDPGFGLLPAVDEQTWARASKLLE